LIILVYYGFVLAIFVPYLYRKKTFEMAIKAALRKRPISGKRQSLYLDFYPAVINPKNGEETRRESLKMYMFDNTSSPLDKIYNTDNLQLTEQIRQKRKAFWNKPEIYNTLGQEHLKKNKQKEGDFIAYFKKLTKKRNTSNRFLWLGSCDFLKLFKGDSLRFSDITTELCNDFREYLKTTKSKKSDKMQLAVNSQKTYYDKFRSALKQAYKDDYLSENIADKTNAVKQAETQRNHLTLGELNSLVKTDCKSPEVKIQALFSALTGLRRADIQKLIWEEVQYVEASGHLIRFKQKKTGGSETLPITEQAYGLLGERKQSLEKVFSPIEATNQRENRYLSKWVLDAGISNKITFHCFRHTFATLQL
jgi:integrase